LLAKARIVGDSAVGPAGADTARKALHGTETAVVWKLLADRTIAPVKIALGLTDHAFTDVTSVLAGTLQPGDQVVTGALVSKAQPPGAQGIRR